MAVASHIQSYEFLRVLTVYYLFSLSLYRFVICSSILYFLFHLPHFINELSNLNGLSALS